MTRREFINQSSLSIGAVYAALNAWGFIYPAPAGAFDLQKTDKTGKVLILGAGLAGLAAAYELEKLGYQCTLLEARTRAGGRIWTIREGTQETEIGGEKQIAHFDKGLYLNAGAARIPNHHELSIHYCRELKIPLEVFINMNEAAYFYAEGQGTLANQPIKIRQLHADLRGYTAELAAKAIHAENLDAELSSEDAEKLIAYLKAEGDLVKNNQYQGSERRGYGFAFGATAAEAPAPAFALPDIIKSGLLHPAFSNVGEYTYHQQPTLLQPVGGMDRLVEAFKEKVGHLITYQAEVKEIYNLESGVKVLFQNNSGKTQEITADYCICTLPLPMLKKVKSNLSGDIQRAADFVPYMKTGKIGLQFKRRFWEEDDGIFGGISKTNMDITQIFYPSYGFTNSKGILKGYYNFHERAVRFADLSLADREKQALAEGGKIHPQYATEFENSFSLAWHKIPFSEGGWADYKANDRKLYFPTLLKADGAVYFAGEHTTYLNAWMAGAFESARRVVKQIHERVQAD
ncbi:MAG: flavin monoamine oxidase family protein [Microscillaceae bacterium]|nr:flavin monoamine oxidase family protein [Microscillaceae bacterium]